MTQTENPQAETRDPQSTISSPTFETLSELFLSLSDVFRPPERLTVSEAAEKYVRLNTPGAYVGPYKNATAPYMVEPMDTLASRNFEGLIFVGPAQSAKTQALILNFLAYTTVVDPMDMIIYSPTMTSAKDFSVRRVDRMNRFSPAIGAMIMPDRDADNKYDKQYKSGVMLSLGWPTVSQFAGRPVGRLALTDYDRMPDDVEGDGNAYDLAAKRATTFGSFRMTLAESSPSRPLTTTKWVAQTMHEAPPTTGILALYNRGDRRRYYWPCKHCAHWFEGNFRHLKWAPKPNAMDAAKTVKMVCPSCNGEMTPDDRKEMLVQGRWLKDGQGIENGEVIGEGWRSKIASFWLNGVAAGFVTWPELVVMYLNAEEERAKTGSEEALKKFFNNDLGEPYVAKKVELERLPEVLKSRAEPMPERQVPSHVRFLVGTVDVQTNAFDVGVFGVSPGSPFDITVVDRFQLFKSKRLDGDGERLWVKPGTYLEDWNEIRDHVIDRSYPLSDGSGRTMRLKLTLCDSGGRSGVTPKAYDFGARCGKAETQVGLCF